MTANCPPAAVESRKKPTMVYGTFKTVAASQSDSEVGPPLRTWPKSTELCTDRPHAQYLSALKYRKLRCRPAETTLFTTSVQSPAAEPEHNGSAITCSGSDRPAHYVVAGAPFNLTGGHLNIRATIATEQTRGKPRLGAIIRHSEKSTQPEQ